MGSWSNDTDCTASKEPTAIGGRNLARMKNGVKPPPKPAEQRIELGQYMVADPTICHGKLSFKGTRIFVRDVLADVERGLSWDFIMYRWGGGKVSKAAIAEAVQKGLP